VSATLRGSRVRSEVDSRSESMGRRIRDGELAKVPYLLIVGDREVETRTASVRARHGDLDGDLPLAGLAVALRAGAPAA
jgi:threonyl-tRNA synthetase